MMPNMSIEEQLRSLTLNETAVLKLKCQDLKYDVIGERLGYSIDWVQLQMSSAYRKLGFNKQMHWTQRKKILEEDICPKLRDIREEIVEEVPQLQPELQPDPEMLAIVLFDESKNEEEKE